MIGALAKEQPPNVLREIASEIIFEADSVWKTFAGPGGSEIVALQDIHLKARRGEFVCIVGPSGCGKSTFLNLIAGFERPSRGRLRLRDRAITAPGADRGVVFQEHALFPWLTVRQNVAFGPSVRGISREEYGSRVEHYVGLVGLSGFADLYPDQLSGGMRQRAAIARALVNDPEILLMDEPFGALDVLTRESMQRELARIWMETAKTVVFVTHSVDEALLLGDRVVIFSPHPGRKRREIAVDLPRPRDLLDERAIDMKREISGLLMSDA